MPRAFNREKKKENDGDDKNRGILYDAIHWLPEAAQIVLSYNSAIVAWISFVALHTIVVLRTRWCVVIEREPCTFVYKKTTTRQMCIFV